MFILTRNVGRTQEHHSMSMNKSRPSSTKYVVYTSQVAVPNPGPITAELKDYTVFHKKGPLFVFFIIHSNDDQFTQNFYQL